MVALRIIAVVATLGVATALALVRFGGIADGWAWSTTMDALHYPAAMFVTMMLAWAAPRRWTLRLRAAGAAAAVIIAAVAVEVVQPRFGRQAEISDLWIGLGGVAAALLVMLVPAAVKRRRLLALAVASLLALSGGIYVALPAIRDWSIVAARDRLFPVLFDPMEPFATQVWRPQGDGGDPVISLATTPDGPAWRVEMDSAWEGLRLEAGSQDWWGYEALHLRLNNPGPAFELRVRVDDRLDDGSRTRSSHAIDVQPGANELAIPIEDIKFGGEHRTLALCCVDRMHLTLPPTEPAATIELQRVWLE